MNSVRSESAISLSRRIMSLLFGAPASRSFNVRYWDGSWEGPTFGRYTRLTIILRKPGALRRLLLPPTEISAAEAYLRDDFDVEGDMEQLLALASALEKLSSGIKHNPVDVNPTTAHMFIMSPFAGKSLFTLFSTHPPMEERVKRLRKMADQMSGFNVPNIIS